ncbi:MAG: GNAT family N-acetyltransferase [Chloroflexota bacterium]
MIAIRSLRKDDDFSDLISLSRQFFGEYETHHRDFFKIDHLEDEQIIAYFASFCNRDTRQALVALDGERIVAYITVYVHEQVSYWQVKRLGEISGLMVQPEYRKQGIAGRLLAAAKSFFAAQGVRYFAVYTAVANRAALEFYAQHGLVPLYTTMLGEIDAPPGPARDG